MMKSIKNSISWIFIQNPRRDDLAMIQKIFDPHPSVIAEFNSRIPLPKIEEFPDYTFLVLHYPNYNPQKQATEFGEVDFLFNQENFATICLDKNNPLRYLFEREKGKEKSLNYKLASNCYSLLLRCINEMLDTCLPKLSHVIENLNDIEDQIFLGQERRMVQQISFVKRDILNFRRVFQPQSNVLEQLLETTAIKDKPKLTKKLTRIIAKNNRIWHILDGFKEVIESLEATNDSLLSHKLNEIGRVLGTISVIFLPASLVATIFGMSMPMPIEDFFIILSIIVLALISTIVFLRWKRYL